MTTTPLSTPTQIRDSYPRGFGPASVDQLARSSSSKLEAHPSWSRHRHYDDNGSLPSTGTTRRDDDPSHDPHSPPPPSTSSHGKELGNSVSPSKYSDTWLARNDRGEQVNLPGRPYSWSPSQLASYLARALHTHDGTPLDPDIVQSMTEFVQDSKINGRVFLSLDQEDFQEMYDLDPFWRNAMWDAAYTLRKRALPYKRSRASNTVVKHAQARSIMDVFGRTLHGTDDTKPIAVASGVKLEPKDEENEALMSPPDGVKIDSASFGNLRVSLSPKPQPESCQGGQPTQVPELVPVLPPSPSTPTDVILNEVSEMPYSTTLYQQAFISQDSHGSSFPVFQEPEDAPDEASITPHRSIDVMSTPASKEESELPTAEFCVSADEGPSTTPRDIPVETEKQPSQQDFTSQLLTTSQSVKGKDKASVFNHITSSVSKNTPTLTGELHHNITNPESAFAKPQTDSEKELLQTIEVLQARLTELENQLEVMEKASFTPEAAYPYIREQQKQRYRHSTTSSDDFPDGETEYAHHPCSDLAEIVFKNATDFDVTRSWQNALILLAGATTGVTVIFLPGLWRHLWNKW